MKTSRRNSSSTSSPSPAPSTASATTRSGLWDETDQFYYDHLSLPDGQNLPLKVQSIVGLIPLFAVQPVEPEALKQLPEFAARMEWYLEHRPDSPP